MTPFHAAMRAVFDLLLPRFCVGCRKNAFFLCEECFHRIKRYKYFLCPVCGRRDVQGKLDESCRRKSGLTRFLGAPLPYTDPLTRKLIHAFKYQRAKEISILLSRILIEFLDENHFMKNGEKYRGRMILVPVPLISFRERERGFNQATEIAMCLAARYNIEIWKDALSKQKNSRPQAELKSPDERQANLANAFVSQNKTLSLRGRRVLLVDDVYTSGATMKECAKALRKGGAKEVWGITVARG